MRVYITGIAGMMGRALHKLHVERGDEVSGCDIQYIHDTPFSYEVLDIRNYHDLVFHMQGEAPDRVYHVAAMLGVKHTEDNPEKCRLINELGTWNVVRACASVKASHLVFASSAEVYGNRGGHVAIPENFSLNGNNVYALSKIRGEHLVEVASLTGVKTHTVRLFNCYGPHQVRQFYISRSMDRAINGLPIRIFGNPYGRRSYLYSEDAAQHIIDVADNAPSGETVNVAHPDTHTLESVAELIEFTTGSEVEREVTYTHYDDRKILRDIPDRVANSSLLRKYSDHKPRPLHEGISNLFNLRHTLRNDWVFSE